MIRSVRLPKVFTRNYKVVTMDLGSTEKPEKSIVKEGKAEIFLTDGLFYNPVQEFNRDLSVSVLQLESKYFEEGKTKLSKEGRTGFTILEALSASGLRSIRYAKEVANVKEIIANDISRHAVENIKTNIKHNNVEHLVTANCNDAVDIMFQNRAVSKRFHVVDLDPYGCPTPFLDSAVQSVSDGGVLMVTCTDMAVLCGNTPETCYVKYGSVALKCVPCHEMALRIVLQCIESYAGRYKRYILPLLSISADFYVRVFVRVFSGASKCKLSTSKLSMVFQCNGCGSITLQPLGCTKQSSNGSNVKYFLPPAPSVDKKCEHCGGKHQMGGPVWSAPIHDPNYVADLLKIIEGSELETKKRLFGTLSMIREELMDVPLYHKADKLVSIIHASTLPMMTFRSAILNGGYRVSYSHALKSSIKTDAPMSFLLDILREWAKEKPVSEKHNVPGSPCHAILNAPITNKIDFSLRPDANPLSREMKLLRFQENPERFWGPGSRSKFNLQRPDKAVRNQNKKSKKRHKEEEEEESGDNSKHSKVEENMNGS